MHFYFDVILPKNEQTIREHLSNVNSLKIENPRHKQIIETIISDIATTFAGKCLWNYEIIELVDSRLAVLEKNLSKENIPKAVWKVLSKTLPSALIGCEKIPFPSEQEIKEYLFNRKALCECLNQDGTTESHINNLIETAAKKFAEESPQSHRYKLASYCYN